MAREAGTDASLRPLAPGELLRIGNGKLELQVAPQAGGRIAGIHCAGVEWLCSHDENSAALSWGSYPMLPWAGRIRRGQFRFDGRDYQLATNLGAHAIHGVAFMLPWRVDAHSPTQLDMSLQLPRDASWPFGGVARQHIAVAAHRLRMELVVTAELQAMPRPVLGWHPWFRSPERLEFMPDSYYPRDSEGLATQPLAQPVPPPWDDCFINSRAVVLHRAGQALRLTSGCNHWVIYDERAGALGVEPQSGPPDAFNLDPARRLAPGQAVSAWFLMEWR